VSERQHKGFTLLELLVALAVFSLVSVMAYAGLRTVLQSKQQTEQHAARLQQVQSAILLLERDLGQFVPRPVRDEYGDAEMPLRTADYGAIKLAFTRAGRANPTGLPRSTLQRVAYGIEEEVLQRYSWPVLDRAQDSTPYRAVLLDRVREFNLRYLDDAREWQSQWPPSGGQPGALEPLPRALEVTLVLEDLGEIRRLFPLFVEPLAPAGEAGGADAPGEAKEGNP
jgi:general secretion pathway protein J